MFVCICKGISDRQIIEAIKQGATNLELLIKKLEVCSNCCKCEDMVKELLVQNTNHLPPFEVQCNEK